MAEGALFHLAGKVLGLLGSFTLPEVKLAFGVQTEIEKLTSTVSTIQAMILDAEKQSSYNHQIKDWLRKIKGVLHDADDLLDDFSAQVLRHKVMRKTKVRIFSSSSNRIAFSPNKHSFHSSRTLDLSYLQSRKMPSSIGKLKHLRYLDVSKNVRIKILPNSIAMLLNLRTLKLKNCHALRELPWDTKNLVNLKHLDISGCFKLTHMPHGLGNLTSLEIIPWFVVNNGGFKAMSSSGLSELKELSNLGGRLVIYNMGHGKDEMVECKAANMKEKQHLH